MITNKASLPIGSTKQPRPAKRVENLAEVSPVSKSRERE